MLREINAAQHKTRDVAERAQRDIRDIYRMGNNTSTNIVVLEDRSINDDRYSVVGKISLARGDRGNGAAEEATVWLGIAFDSSVGLTETAEQKLGEGFDGREWYGGWLYTGSTVDVEEAKAVIDSAKAPDADAKIGLPDMATYHDGAMKMLWSMQETLAILVEAANDASLNPVKEIPS
jgi:hypothetical protein